MSAMTAALYLQTVVQSEVLVTFACGEQQMTRPLGVCRLVARNLSALHRRRLQILPDPNKLLPRLQELRQEPAEFNLLLHYSSLITLVTDYLLHQSQ